MRMNTNEVSLELAKRLTEQVNQAWNDGSLLQAVTPMTQTLLTYWFGEEHCSLRCRNFHDGQRQAILNIIYLHEVARVEKVTDTYERVDRSLLASADLEALAKP